MKSRLIRLNRLFSWILVVFTLLMIISGYGITRSFVKPLSPFWFCLRNVHLWFCLLFIIQFFFHIVVVEFTLRSKWLTVLRKNWKTNLSSFLIVKLIQKITGYIMVILGLLVILTGLNLYLPRLGPVFSLFHHVRVEFLFIVSFICHIALGAKLVFFRRKRSSLLTDGVLVVLSIVGIGFLFYLNTF